MNCRVKAAGKAIAAVIVIVIVIAIELTGFEIYKEYEASTATSQNIKVSNVSLKDVGPTNAMLVVIVNLTNPSSYSTPPFNADFRVFVASAYLGNGTFPETTVPPTSSVFETVDLPLNYSTFLGNSSLISSLKSASSIPLTITGTIHARVLFGLFPVSFPFQKQTSFTPP